MEKVKNIFLALKQALSQMMRSVLGRDEANDTQASTQQNRYYT